MSLFGRNNDRPDGLVWDDAPSTSYPYEQAPEPDIEGLRYMAKGRGGSIEVDGDNVYIWVGQNHAKIHNTTDAIEAGKGWLGQFRHL